MSKLMGELIAWVSEVDAINPTNTLTSGEQDAAEDFIEFLWLKGYRIVKLQKCSGPIEYDGSLEPAYFVDEEL